MKSRVAAVQLDISYLSTPQEFVDRVRGPIEHTAQEGAQLIVLPNRCSYALLGMFGGEESIPTMIRERGPLVWDLYIHIFQSLAERTHTWLAPGSVPEIDQGQWFNTAILFSPDGKVFGKQRQCFRSPEEQEWGTSGGGTVEVFDTGIGRVGFVVGEDVRYPEVSRILALLGANILLHPASYTTWTDESFLADLWREVQSNQVFGVQACAVGERFKGRSAVFAPVEYTPDHTGFLAQAANDSLEATVCAELDLDALQRVVDGYPIFDFFNYDLYRSS